MAKHFTYRGEALDMDMLKYQNQHKVALGNGKMNARGDIIGSGGTVVQTLEERIAEKERELQIPDFIPEHQLRNQTPDDSFDDNMFELSPVEKTPAEPSFEVDTPEKEVKAAPRRARTKDTDQE